MKKAWLILVILPVLIAGCSRQKSETIIAKVGDETLTLREARTHIDSSKISSPDQLRNYVIHWVNEELLYQEARKDGIESTEQFQKRLQEARKQLANQQYLDRQIYDSEPKIEEQMIADYYERNRSEFFHREDAVKLNMATFLSRERAAYFASQLFHGNSWRDVVDNMRQDSGSAKFFIGSVSDRYFTRRTLMTEEIWKVSTALNINDVSFPVKVPEGYCIAQLLARKKKGEQADYDIVRDEVRQRVLIELRHKRYIQLLENLRSKYKVEIFSDQFTKNDTTHSANHD